MSFYVRLFTDLCLPIKNDDFNGLMSQNWTFNNLKGDMGDSMVGRQ